MAPIGKPEVLDETMLEGFRTCSMRATSSR